MGARVPPGSTGKTGSGIDLGNRKINNATWDVRTNYERRAIARDTTLAAKEMKERELHKLDSVVGILIGPSTSSLTFDASLSESSVGKRGCGWGWRADFRFSFS